MRRLFGFKSKSSGPLEPLSTNHDSRAEKSTKSSKATARSTTPAPPQQHGLGLSIPTDALQEEEDQSTRSLHAHFAATPRVLSPVEGEVEGAAAGNPSASSSNAPAAAGAGGADPNLNPGIRSRTASSRLSVSRDPTAGASDDAARSASPWSTTTQQLQRTTSPLSFSPSGSSNSPYYTAAGGGGGSIHPSLARVVSGGGGTVGGDPGAIYGECCSGVERDDRADGRVDEQHRPLGANWPTPSWWIMCRIARGRGRRSCRFFCSRLRVLNG